MEYAQVHVHCMCIRYRAVVLKLASGIGEHQLQCILQQQRSVPTAN